MKKLFLATFMAIFGVTAIVVAPADHSVVYAQKKGDKGEDKKKNPPGPPVMKDKPKPKNEKPRDDKSRKGKKPGEY
jgi:hypothetical protein